MKIALILSGGGAKGCFQVGVMKQLIEKGILPDLIYGTSTGALQAAGYSHIGITRLEQVWLAIKSKSEIMRSNWRNLWRDGKYDMTPLAKKLNDINNLDREPGLSCEAIVTRVCLEDGRVEYIPYDHPEFAESVLASASVPFVSRPVKIGKKHYIDGGVRDQVPIRDMEKLLKLGYRVIVVSTNPLRINPFNQWKMPKIFPLWSIIVRVADDILPTETWLDELRAVKKMQSLSPVPVEIYMPETLWMGTEDYEPSKIRDGILMGYQAQPKNLMEVDL